LLTHNAKAAKTPAVKPAVLGNERPVRGYLASRSKPPKRRLPAPDKVSPRPEIGETSRSLSVNSAIHGV